MHVSTLRSLPQTSAVMWVLFQSVVSFGCFWDLFLSHKINDCLQNIRCCYFETHLSLKPGFGWWSRLMIASCVGYRCYIVTATVPEIFKGQNVFIIVVFVAWEQICDEGPPSSHYATTNALIFSQTTIASMLLTVTPVIWVSLLLCAATWIMSYSVLCEVFVYSQICGKFWCLWF